MKWALHSYAPLPSWCHENGSLSVHTYLSITQYTGSWGERYQEAHGILYLRRLFLWLKHLILDMTKKKLAL